LKKWCKIWGFRAKNPVFRSKSLEKFRKKFGKSSEIAEKVQKFQKLVFPNVRYNFGNFGNLEIPNFPKITKKWRSTRNSEITKYSFRLKNRLESLVKSLECRTILSTFNFICCAPVRPGVYLINILGAIFLLISFCQKNMKPKCNRKKLRKALLYKKMLALNVDEIDPWCQLHQHFTRAFFEQKCIVWLFSNYSLAL